MGEVYKMFYCGYLSGKEPEEVFREIRQIGICAEAAIFCATSRVNTHKGFIFTMGILAAALFLYEMEKLSG